MYLKTEFKNKHQYYATLNLKTIIYVYRIEIVGKSLSIMLFPIDPPPP